MTHNKMPTKDIKDYRTQTVNPYNISVDRIDSSSGYTKDNIQLVTVAVNHMKWNMNEETFLEMCDLVSKNLKIKST